MQITYVETAYFRMDYTFPVLSLIETRFLYRPISECSVLPPTWNEVFAARKTQRKMKPTV
jgi:hypothetical protein